MTFSRCQLLTLVTHTVREETPGCCVGVPDEIHGPGRQSEAHAPDSTRGLRIACFRTVEVPSSNIHVRQRVRGDWLT